MSRDTRFKPGQSGNLKGRPRKRRPNVSAFDIVFDQTLTVTQDGAARELTVDEALQLQTYKAALEGKRMAIREVLKMIEKRELALAKRHPTPARTVTLRREYDANNADEAMRILGIASEERSLNVAGYSVGRLKLHTWVTQLALSRTGRRRIDKKSIDDIERLTLDPGKLHWPRSIDR